MCDEVYRPVFHYPESGDEDCPPSVLSLGYEATVVTGSLSKAYGLAGLRVGWLASRSPKIVEACANGRRYATISVGALAEQAAAFALAPHTVRELLGRNVSLATLNLDILAGFVVKHKDKCSWVEPLAGTTAFIRFERNGMPVNATKFCEALLSYAGVLFVPGDRCFGAEFAGYVRFGFACETTVLQQALREIVSFFDEAFGRVPSTDESKHL